MSSYTATTTFSTVGTATASITPGFQSTAVTVTVTPAVGAAVQAVQHCMGWTDGTRKMCDSIFMNMTTGNAKSVKTTSKLIQLWGEDVNGSLIVILEATLNSFTTTQVKFDVAIANINYQVSVKCDS